LSKKRRKAHRVAAPQIVQQVAPSRPFMSDEAIALLTRKTAKPTENIFLPAKAPPGVVPSGATMAMDDATAFAGNLISTEYGMNLGGFGAAIPMTVLATWAQRPEYRKISDVPAVEMTRRWIKITSVDQDDDKTDRIQAIEAGLAKFKVRDAFRDAIRNDGLLGRGHIYIDLGAEGDERATPIGNGKDAGTKQKVRKGSLKGVRSVDPLWVYPQGYNTSDPTAADWYDPQAWFVMGKSVHASRLLTIVAREVPDILKPAYSFGGLSLTQMAQPYVDNWLRTRQSVADIVNAFSVFVLKTNLKTGFMGSTAQPGLGDQTGAGLDARLMLFNMLRDNRGVMAIDKDGEDFMNVSANLGTLDRLQAQAQEQMASVSSIPKVKLLGDTPAGLNASSDGEIRVFYDNIHAAQEDHLRDPLQTVIDIVQLSECGDIDPSIRFGFEPLWSMDEKQIAEIREIEARTDETLIRSRTITRAESRQRVASDIDAPYVGLDVDAEVPMSESEATDVLSKIVTMKLAANEASVLGDQATLQALSDTGAFPEITSEMIASADVDPPAPTEGAEDPVPSPLSGIKAEEHEQDED
jgi:phage-related protein (TIGR01555 family)